MRLMTRIHRLANDTGCTVVPSVDEVVNKADTARGDSEQIRAERLLYYRSLPFHCNF